MKKIFLLLTLSSSIFAQSMCEEYCGTCNENPSETSCERVFKVCGCAPAKKIPVTESSVTETATTTPPANQSIREVETSNKAQLFQTGIGADLRFQSPSSHGSFKNLEDVDSYGGGLHFVARLNFNNYFSFLTGINLAVQYIDLGLVETPFSHTKIESKAYLDYTTFSLEIPLTLRFSYEINNMVKPYIGYSFILQKPLYEWIDYKFDFYYSNQKSSETSSYSGAFEITDWEIVHGIGLGVELCNKYAVELQTDFNENFRINLAYFF